MNDSRPEASALSMTALRVACSRKRRERDKLRKQLEKIRQRKGETPAVAIKVVALIILGPKLSKRLKTWTTEWREGESPVPVEQTADVFEAFVHRLIGTRKTIGIVTAIAAIPAFFTFGLLWKQNNLMKDQISIAEKEAYQKSRVELLTKIYDLNPPSSNYGPVRTGALRTFLEMERRAGNDHPDLNPIDLIRAPLGDALIQKLDLSRVDLRFATMPTSNGMCDMIETDCRNAVFDGASIVNANVHRSAFIGSVWKNLSMISHASISESLFQDVKMMGGSISDSLISDCDFTEANLSGATIRGVRFTKTPFNGANLNGANFAVSWTPGTDRGPLPDSPDFCEFVAVDFSKADLRGTVFAPETVFDNVVFNETLIDEKTVLPNGIDPKAVGLIFRKEGSE